ncbi:peroxiredoxin family protein [Nitrospina watsonii]|uniref:Thiol-disulfide oxidoreductase resA n=1 Tax=Nitrospina watsonii TaxID=1323948 RepID=A0ABM9HGY9_9BACT|nr:TlpA disulfide reductase family protein [Nitrospina watsonii]CAI2719290.1 Putative Thiol-disulfide oxidoreductase resA [Nitrospina watsonii]
MSQTCSTRPLCQPGRFRFRHNRGWAAVLLAAVLLAHAPAAAGPDTDPAPAFTLKSLHGEDRSLHDYRGRYLLLNFWATWCGPCKIEMPSLEALHRRFQTNNLTVLGISNDPFGARVVTPFMAAYDLTFPVLLDPDQEISKRYGVHSLPTTFLIDPEGRILGVLTGAEDWSKPETLAYFRDLLNGPSQSPAGPMKSTASAP